jgi:hypothetical protein
LSDKRDKSNNFNGKVRLHDDVPDSPGQEVWCRHLAMAYYDAPRKGEFLDAVTQTRVDIERHFGGRLTELTTRQEELSCQADALFRHLVNDKSFGRFLADVSSRMKVTGESRANLLIESGDHAMAALIQWKNDAGSERICVSFYDPNITSNHRRVEVNNPAQLAKWSFTDFCPLWQSYFGRRKADISVSVTCSDVAFERPTLLTYANAFPHRYDILLALKVGEAEAIQAYGQVMNTRGLRGDEAVRLLEAKSKNGVPGLAFALHKGHAETVQAFGAVLNTLDIRGDESVRLLDAKRADGVPGLLFALENGHAETVRAFGEVLKKLDIRGEAAVRLLEADANGVPGLAFALQNGHAETVLAFGEVLKKLDIRGEAAVNLLEAKNANGVPGLAFALKNRHAETVQAFGAVLNQIEIREAETARLLEGKCS